MLHRIYLFGLMSVFIISLRFIDDKEVEFVVLQNQCTFETSSNEKVSSPKAKYCMNLFKTLFCLL